MPALIFDCDGVLADTEQDGHLRAFNEMFAELGVPAHWSVADYAEKVKIGGGKERLRSLLSADFVAAAGIPSDPDAQRDLVASWHRRKTEIYTDLVEGGVLPPRSGVRRITAEAAAAGWQLAVASTSARPSVTAVLEHVVGAELAARFSVFAGDDAEHKKPAPDIYLLALEHLGVGVDEAIVVEDSENGLRAALAAGLRAVVTVSTFTWQENFSGASLVVTALGDPDGGEQSTVLSDPLHLDPGPVVSIDDLDRLLQRDRPTRTETPTVDTLLEVGS